MTQEEIIEGNKLIAEFDGWKFINDSPGEFPNGYYITEESFTILDNFAYQEYWDWLMHIVERIESLNHKVEIYQTSCNIEYHPKKEECISCTDADTKIEAVWLAVVEFIKFYNSQENKKP